MKYWEYMITTETSPGEKELNEQGDLGWELVQIHISFEKQFQLIWKREKKFILKKKK